MITVVEVSPMMNVLSNQYSVSWLADARVLSLGGKGCHIIDRDRCFVTQLTQGGTSAR